MDRKKKILIVEDDPDILNILEFIFSDNGYEVELSNDGEKTDHLAKIKPDIILLDIRLENSGRNGATICAALKAGWETHDLPVILLSAEAELKQISKTCGADDYVAKPFDLEDLIYKVKVLLTH
jgi:two-component system response regulator VicR